MSTLKGLRVRRGRVKASITRAKSYLESVNENTTIEELSTRLKAVEDYWRQFVLIEDEMAEFQDEIDGNDAVSSGELTGADVFAQVEATYFTVHSCLSQEINGRQQQLKAVPSPTPAPLEQLTYQAMLPPGDDIALPKIVIPPFSGEYVNWMAFRDLFIGSVDRKQNLSQTQKFYYLVSFLRGEAAELIKNIPISDEHYLPVWDKLEKRYDRPHLVALQHIKSSIKLPTVQSSNSKSLRKLLDGADECLRGLNAISMNDRNPWLIYLLLNKLDVDTRRVWSEEFGSRTDVTIDMLIEFLDKRFAKLESIDMFGPSTSPKVALLRSHVIEKPLQLCLLCKADHNLSKCPKFESLSSDMRRKFAKDKSLCFNCLKQGHNVAKCNSSFRCRTCNSRHHTLVHSSSSAVTSFSGNTSTREYSTQHSRAERPVDTDTAVLQSSLARDSSTTHTSSGGSLEAVRQSLTSNHSIPCSQPSSVILPTAIVHISDRCGNYVKVRALIDSGSQVSFITESCVQRLGLSRSNARMAVRGVASAEAGTTRGRVIIKVRSDISDSSIDVHPYILNHITADVPLQQFSTEAWHTISHLKLADPSFNIPATVDLLLGADVVWSVLIEGKIFLKDPHLFALNSIFGWIVSGQVDMRSPVDIASYTVTIDIDRKLQRFWEVEEGCLDISESVADDPAEISFQRTHKRSADGRYVVELPFKHDNTNFADTSIGAISRLRNQERKLVTDPHLHRQYSSFLDEYLALGHMEPVPENELHIQPQYYLPHHAIVKPESTTTKLRVVFDGSFKDKFGNSLNDALFIGPPVQRDLFNVSLRFRLFPYVFTSDITKMFRQIWIAKQHRDFQRIVWRSNTDCPVQHFRLCTVTYGTASAPFLSVRVLQQLAQDNQVKFPRAASIILNNIYVDDVMAGANTVNELVAKQTELVELLATAGFKLRKWCSNCEDFLNKLPSDECECQPFREGISNISSFVKILGLYWNPCADAYSFRVKGKLSGEVTKRTILSEVARVFDIHGFLSPSTILMKILFQRLWLLKLGWDEQLPLDISRVWSQLTQSLHRFESISIPRQIFIDTGECELHCFCDASQVAYAAVIYCVKRSSNSQPLINIVTAKARVAPLKIISIPRLELCGALLLCRLLALVKRTINVSMATVYAWTDSEIVLHWLSSPPRNWKMFVANRTEEILLTLPRRHWNYVNTHSNPADCASRGVNPEQLVQAKLWWCGPEWLALPRETWPKTKFDIDATSETVAAEKRKAVLYSGVSGVERSVLLILADRCSSWNRLIRVIAYIRRFVLLVSRRTASKTRIISLEELHLARMKLFCCIQRETFAVTINNLTSKVRLSKRDTLNKLSPFIDEVGVLRVGGRIQSAAISFNIKHPVILPRNHIAELIVADMHKTYMHAGVSALFSIVRQHYWILGARNLIRAVVFRCKRCFLLRRKTSEQMMANLPQPRVQATRPFRNSGCDFAGPISIKMTNCKRPRISKAYICLFICMSVKAIHLELVSDLSSEAFVAAFRRFTSRRGKCSNLYTDNGTNFKGAHRLLDDMRSLLQKETTNADVYESLAQDGTNWHFIPPSAPHFGGLWESGVRSVKFHLRRVVGDAVLSFEEMYTVLTQIEATINSRPLCAISDTDCNPLTPSHFLIGEPLTAVPEPSAREMQSSRQSRWNLIQNMVKGFWKQWSNEYLTALQERSKWTESKRSFELGDVVIIKEPNLPPSKWLLGRIIAVHPGHDNRVRVVTIKTAKGIYKRPITKIALLPNH